MPRYRRKATRKARRTVGGYMQVKNITPPQVIKVELKDSLNDFVFANGLTDDVRAEGTSGLGSILWNSLLAAELLCKDPVHMVGYTRLHQAYQAYRIPSASLSVTIRRKIESGGTVTAGTQKIGAYAFLYESNDGAATIPPWYKLGADQNEHDENIRKMKADSRCSWVKLPAIYAVGAGKPVTRKTVSRRVSTMTSLRSTQPAHTRSLTTLNAILPSGAGGVVTSPSKKLYTIFGGISEDFATFPPDIEIDLVARKRCVFYHRQDDVTIL